MVSCFFAGAGTVNSRLIFFGKNVKTMYGYILLTYRSWSWPFAIFMGVVHPLEKKVAGFFPKHYVVRFWLVRVGNPFAISKFDLGQSIYVKNG